MTLKNSVLDDVCICISGWLGTDVPYLQIVEKGSERVCVAYPTPGADDVSIVMFFYIC